MPPKTQQLQIRVTPQQKAALKRQASAAGRDVSSYVMSRVMLEDAERFSALLRAFGSEHDTRFALAELNDFLVACPPGSFREAVAQAPLDGVSPYLRNYVAAMVEQAADLKQVPPPAWVRDIEPLEAPRFVTALPGLRLHLLCSAPVPFKRRNIFIDASIGARV